MSAPIPYRIDRVPALLRLPVGLYGLVGGVGLELTFRAIRAWTRLEREGLEARNAVDPVIECFWHEDVFAYLSGSLSDRRRVTFFHPSVLLKPVEVSILRRGWRCARGSAGNDGRAAAEQMVEALRDGYSALITPDGPTPGPARKLKMGVLHIARQSGRPIVPIRHEYSRAVTLPSWDRKRLALPGSTVVQRYGAPIWVGEDLESAAAELQAALGP